MKVYCWRKAITLLRNDDNLFSHYVTRNLKIVWYLLPLDTHY